jgi:hypothetical protein
MPLLWMRRDVHAVKAVLDQSDAAAIQAYVIKRANEDKLSSGKQ